MSTFIIVLLVIVSVLMCGIVLLQESKGGGLASSFSSYNQIMGVRKTTDVVEKITWCLALGMVILAVGYGAFTTSTQSGSIADKIQDETAQPTFTAPANEAAPVELPAAE